jgi:hypothetical protein
MKHTIRCRSFRAVAKGTLRGFATIHVAELRLAIHDVALHKKGEARWAQLPSKAVVRDGRHVTPNKATADVKALAREHGPAAIQELARLAAEAMSEQARVAAIKELLDRGYGRAPQAVTGEADGEPVVVKHIVTWLE